MNFVDAFSASVEISNAVDAAVLTVMEVIQVAWVRRWTQMWLETDSLLVLSYSHSPNLITWRLRSRWLKCLCHTRQLSFHVSHIFREGNGVADKLACCALHEGSVWLLSLSSFTLINLVMIILCKLAISSPSSLFAWVLFWSSTLFHLLSCFPYCVFGSRVGLVPYSNACTFTWQCIGLVALLYILLFGY